MAHMWRRSLYRVVAGILAIAPHPVLQSEAVVYTVGAIASLHDDGGLIREGLQRALTHMNQAGGLQGAAGTLVYSGECSDQSEVLRGLAYLAARGVLAVMDIPGDGDVWMRMLKQIEHPPLIWGPADRSIDVAHESHVINTAPPLSDEIRALISYAYRHGARRTFAVFHDDSAWGMRALKLVKTEVETLAATQPGLLFVGAAQVARDTVNVQAAVDTLVTLQPQVILCFTDRPATYQCIPQLLNRGMVSTLFMGPSNLFSLQYHLKRARGINFIATSWVPDPRDRSTMLVDEFHRDIETSGQEKLVIPSVLELGAYFSMRLFQAVIARADSLTVDSIRTAAQSIQNLTVCGLPVSFDIHDRTLSRSLWLSPGLDVAWIRIQ